MTRTERLHKLETVHAEMLAEYAELEKLLSPTVETITEYAGGSRYSLAGPGDDEIIGYRKVITYKNPQYLERRNHLANELERSRTKIRDLKEKLKIF